MTSPAPSAQEHAFAFDCEGETLVGILHRPASPAQDRDAHRTGVVVVVGGPQYRAGSHRQFVHLARHLAAAGHPVLRFDVRGMGDSSGAQRSFEALDADIGAAIQALMQHQPGLRRVVLWGLCDGASAALLYLQRNTDPRVRGLCLLNPWVRSEASLARTHVKHYYRQRLMQRDFWAKLFSGQVAGKAVRELVSSLKAARQPVEAAAAAELPFQVRMARAWQSFGGPVLLVLSGRDYTAREFTETVAAHPAWKGALVRPGVQRHEARAADHTFSATADRTEVEQATAAWLAGLEHAGTDTAAQTRQVKAGPRSVAPPWWHRQPRDPAAGLPTQAAATPTSAAGRLRRYLAEHGLRLTLLKAGSDVLRRASGGWARLNVYALTAQPLALATASAAGTGSTVIENISSEDPRVALIPRPRHVLKARYAAGAECRMALVKGRFAGMHWVVRGQYVEDEVRCTFILDRPDLGVWDFDVYVEPAFRGSRVFLRLWQAAEHSLAAQGLQWSFSRIDVLNAGSLASHARLGARVVGRAAFVTLGPWQFSWASVAPRWQLARGGTPGPGFRIKDPGA